MAQSHQMILVSGTLCIGPVGEALLGWVEFGANRWLDNLGSRPPEECAQLVGQAVDTRAVVEEDDGDLAVLERMRCTVVGWVVVAGFRWHRRNMAPLLSRLMHYTVLVDLWESRIQR